ncbi:MAG TPA: hypothetical protein ENH00_09155 [Actinobacteria bacterium]|nr:hypothetical protein [Actinomycetota bacterium]
MNIYRRHHTGDWVDSVLPPDGLPKPVARIANLRIRDGSDTFTLGPVDQLLAVLSHTYLTARMSNEHVVFRLPRGRHDIAILVGIVFQLLRVQAWHETDGVDQGAFSGPVVVVGRDTAVQKRLSQISLPGTGVGQMADAVAACRVRADGRIVEPDGSVLPYRAGAKRLLYLNTRVGWPDLQVSDAVGVIDRTTLRDRRSYEAAVGWLQGRACRIVTVADTDDPEVHTILNDLGASTINWELSAGVMSDVGYVVGAGQGDSRLSTNTLSGWCPTLIDHPVIANDVDRLFRRAYGALASARQVDAPYPIPVRNAARLLSVLQRSPVNLASYGKAAAGDPRLRSPKSLQRLLEQHHASFVGPWRAFETTDWSALRRCVLEVFDMISEKNPKQHALLDALDLVRRRQPASKLVIRAPNRVAATLMREELEEHGALDGRMEVNTWSSRSRWRAAATEIWPGLPPWAHRSLLSTAETTDVVLVGYPGELQVLSALLDGSADQRKKALTSSAIRFGFIAPDSEPAPRIYESSQLESRQPDPSDISVDVDYGRIAARALSVIDDIGEERSVPMRSRGSEEIVSLVPIRLDGKSIWWVSLDDAVGTLIHDAYHHRLVRELRPGDLVVVPRGEGRTELFSRLVAAFHTSADVNDLDFLLARFRLACWKLRNQSSNWRQVQKRLERNNASAITQARSWANGSTIAPADPEDVQLVARLVGDTYLAKSWAGVASVAKEVRTLHRKLGRIVNGALSEAIDGFGPHMKKVQDLLGESGVEILDEFAVHRVVAIGQPEDKLISQHGTIDQQRDNR